MIYGVTGLLGGGKTYGAVRDMVRHLRKGIVVSNIDLHLDKVSVVNGVPESVLRDRFVYIDPDKDADCWSWPRGDSRGEGSRRVLVVIDEAGEWFSSLERKDLGNFTSWLRQSDKRGQDIYLIVQDATILAKQGRVLCHRWLYMRYMMAWRIPVVGWPLPPPWKYEFHRLMFDQTGKNPIGIEREMRDVRLFGCYQTSAMVGASARASLSKSVNAYEGWRDYDPPSALERPLVHAGMLGVSLLATVGAVVLL